MEALESVINIDTKNTKDILLLMAKKDLVGHFAIN
jgi:hypothetical protein